MLNSVIVTLIFAFDKGECIPNLVVGVLCLTRQKNSRFSAIVVDDNKLVPPKIFAEAFAQGGGWG